MRLKPYQQQVINAPPVVRCLPQDDCERQINSVFAARQMLKSYLKSLFINLLILLTQYQYKHHVAAITVLGFYVCIANADYKRSLLLAILRRKRLFPKN